MLRDVTVVDERSVTVLKIKSLEDLRKYCPEDLQTLGEFVKDVSATFACEIYGMYVALNEEQQVIGGFSFNHEHACQTYNQAEALN